MNWMDAVVGVMILVEVYRCFKEGMVKTVIHLAGLLVAVIFAKLNYEALASYLSKQYEFFAKLQPNIYEALTKNFDSGAQVNTALQNGTFSSSLNLPKILSLAPESQKAQLTDTMNQAVFGELSQRIADMMLYGMSFIMIVVAVMVGIMILTLVIDQFMGLPVLKEVNKLGGIVVGFLKGALNVFVLMTLITFFMPLLKLTWLVDAIQGSTIAIYFYNNNLLLYLIYYLLK